MQMSPQRRRTTPGTGRLGKAGKALRQALFQKEGTGCPEANKQKTWGLWKGKKFGMAGAQGEQKVPDKAGVDLAGPSRTLGGFAILS